MVEKLYISAQELLDDSFRLAHRIYDSGFKPNYIVGVWRGGTPVGIAVQELLKHKGVPTDHIAIRTSSYTGIGEQSDDIRVHGLHYIIENMNAEDSLLIVDDVLLRRFFNQACMMMQSWTTWTNNMFFGEHLHRARKR